MSKALPPSWKDMINEEAANQEKVMMNPMTDEPTDVGTCPRCGEHSMMAPLEINALSRTTRGVLDTPIWVCSDCGMDEGLEDAFHTGATEQTSWPLTERTFDYFIKETDIQKAHLMNERNKNET